jgi:autotransporter-associated beta strand protein
LIRIIAVCAALLSVAAHGKTLTWSGGGWPNAYWNNSANWGGAGIPANGDTINFSGSNTNGMVNTNNISNLILNQIRFTNSIAPGGMFDLRGNAFTLTNGIMVTNTAVIENNITLATANVTADVAAGVNLSLAGSLGGSVGVTKIGPGKLTYSGSTANTYSGLTTVNEGELDLNKPAYVQAIAPYGLGLVIGDGTGTDRVRYLNDGQIWSDVTPVTINSSGVLDLNVNLDEVAPLSLSGGQIYTDSAGQFRPHGTVTVLPAATEATIVGNVLLNYELAITNYTNAKLFIYASISGIHGMTMAGAGQVYLFSSNSYAGLTVVQPGEILCAEDAHALGGTTSGTVVSNGATLIIAVPGNSGITNESLTLNGGSGVDSLWGALDAETGTNTWAGPITNNADSTLDAWEPTAVLHIAGPISGAGGLELTGYGTHSFEGSTANTYAGTTTVDETTTLLLGKSYGITAVPGPLVIGSSATVRLLNSFQIYNASASVTMSDSSLFDLAGFEEWVGPISLQGAQITSGAGLLYFSGNITVNASSVAQSLISGNAQIFGGTYTIANSGHNYSPDLQISANVSSGGGGGGGLIKAGAGEVSLTGNNSFTGPVTVNGGSLQARTSTALGNTNTPATVNSGSSLSLIGTGLDFGFKPLVLSGTGYFFGALFCNGSSSWEGGVTLASDSTIYTDTASSLTLAGVIGGGSGIIKAGPGTLTLSGSTANTYVGLTTVNGGTLVLNKSYATASVPGNLVVNNGYTVRLANSLQTVNAADVLVNGGGLFDFSTCSTYLNTLRGFGTVNFGVGGWLYIGLNNGTSEFDGSFTGTGFASGFTVGKTGSGIFTIGGNSTYTAGITHVYGGKLVINGSQPLIPVTVDAGATLGGSGTVGAIAAYGDISPGNSPGILNSSNVTFSSFGNYTVELTGPNPGSGYDQLNVSGTVSIANATLTVIPNFTAPVSIGQQFVIITNDLADAISGTFNGLANGAQFSAGGYTFRINYNGGSGNDVVLTLWGVPGNTVTVSDVSRGWYNSVGSGVGSVTGNYIAGENNVISDTKIYRNWFVFNVPVFSGSIIHAELLINCYSNASPHGQETYLLRKVTTPIATLEAGGAGLVGIYNDLGTGAVYSVRSIATNESYQKAIIPLNVTFMNDATAASGGQMALGGSIATLDAINNHNQLLFAYSSLGQADDVQLRLTFGTSMVINSTNSGWYDNTGYHNGGNQNYFVGDHSGYLYRNFFVFNLPALSSQLAEAELLVNSYSNFSPYGVETYQLYDVTNSITVLTNDGSGAISTYADLGSGTVYGGRKVYVSEIGSILGIPLNGCFLGAAQTSSGGRIALGGALTSLNPVPTEEGFFSGSTGLPADAQLWLGFLAAPSSHPSFVGAPTCLGNNQFQAAVSGTTGTTNEIQGSFDFQNWDFIRDLVMTNSTASFRYTNNTVVPYRFFRAEQLQ